MDPRVMNSAAWSQLGLAMSYMIIVVGFIANGAAAFLLSHAFIPSLQASGEMPEGLGPFRKILYPIAALCLLLALYSAGRALYVGVNILMQFYPDFAI